MRPLWVMQKRLTYHSADVAGRLLQKMTYDPAGIIEVDGVADLPYCTPFTMSDVEAIGAGAVPSLFASGSSNVAITQTFEFMLASRRDYGLTRDAPTTEPDRKKGILEWIAAFRDAIETDVDGTVDSQLEESVYAPVQFTVRDIAVSEVSWQALVQIQCRLPPWTRGGRTETG